MFKNYRCQASAGRPGFGFGGHGNTCLRKKDHKGPHRAASFIEWTDVDPTLKIVKTHKKSRS